jgi:hypothetical protein
MQVFYTSGSTNTFTLRVDQLQSTSSLTLHLQDMYLLSNTSQSITASYWDKYESIIQFVPKIPSASVGDEYRAYITSGSCSVWHGSVQVYGPQIVFSKSNYENQNTQYVSHQSENEYIILD